MNRLNEETFNHYMYNWQYWDKRNRLCHNMIMEHFEVHKEQMEDLIVEMNQGKRPFDNLPAVEKPGKRGLDRDVMGLIDEISGLNAFLDKYMETNDLPETMKDKIKAQMNRYDGKQPKEELLHEIRDSLYGNSR